jgi:hypothetical protein
MMHVRGNGPRDTITSRIMNIARKDGIWMSGGPYDTEGPNLRRFEFNVGDATMDFTVKEIGQLFERVVGSVR